VRHPKDISWQIVPWNPDEFLEVATKWLLDVHSDAIKKSSMNGEAEAHALHTITAFNPLCALYGILVGGEPGGLLGVLHQNRFERSAELALFLDPKWQMSGLGRLVGEEVVDILGRAGFDELRVFPLSQLSANLCKRLGFVERPIGLTMMSRSAPK